MVKFVCTLALFFMPGHIFETGLYCAIHIILKPLLLENEVSVIHAKVIYIILYLAKYVFCMHVHVHVWMFPSH